MMEGRAPDEVYAEVRKEFGEEELVNLSLAIITINGWNRLAIGEGRRYIPSEVVSTIAEHQRAFSAGDLSYSADPRRLSDQTDHPTLTIFRIDHQFSYREHRRKAPCK
jgi:hypothetical protein